MAHPPDHAQLWGVPRHQAHTPGNLQHAAASAAAAATCSSNNLLAKNSSALYSLLGVWLQKIGEKAWKPRRSHAD